MVHFVIQKQADGNNHVNVALVTALLRKVQWATIVTITLKLLAANGTSLCSYFLLSCGQFANISHVKNLLHVYKLYIILFNLFTLKVIL